MTNLSLKLPQNRYMNKVFSPLQAQVVQWLAAPGDTVRTGDVVVILEAMKMEITLRAPHAGKVVDLRASPGDFVDADSVLVRLEACE